MEIQVVKERDNPFFNRKDLVLNIVHTGTSTPKTIEVKKDLAAKYNVHDSQVVVDFIASKRGLQESEAKIKILNERPPVVEEEEKPAEEKLAEEKPAPEQEPKPAPEQTPVPKPPEQKQEQKPEPKEEKEKNEAQASETE
jgi:ribosomal protein S24E